MPLAVALVHHAISFRQYIYIRIYIHTYIYIYIYTHTHIYIYMSFFNWII